MIKLIKNVGVGSACDPHNPNIHFLKSVIVTALVRVGGFGEGWKGGEAFIFTVSIFNSLEPYGVASSWQKNK